MSQQTSTASLDELRAKLLGLFNAPATNLATLINTSGTMLTQTIKARSNGSRGSAPPSLDLHHWKTQLGMLAKGSDRLFPKEAAALAAALRRLEQDEVGVVFCGHFKAGKSTLLNAALGRALLPMGQIVETGTICRLRSGAVESAVLATAKGREKVLCSTETIRTYSSLIDDAGQRRAVSVLARELELTLVNCPIPEGVSWSDSPGINDEQAMSDRAFTAIQEGDVAVWVINSRIPVSEAEDEFLRRVFASHGSAAVVFVINVFLPEVTPQDWADFKTEIEPRIRTRLEDHKPAMGLDPAVALSPVSVCARAVLVGEKQYGAEELRQLLDQLAVPDDPRVAHSRIYRVVAALESLAANFPAELKAALRENAEWEKTAAAQRVLAAARQREFCDTIKLIFDEAFSDWEKMADTCCGTLANRLTDNLRRDDTYTEQVQTALAELTETIVGEYVRQVNVEAARTGQAPLRGGAVAKLRALWFDGNVAVEVPDNKVGASAAAKGVAVGFIFGPVGWITGGIIGHVMGSSAALKKDLSETRLNIRAAAADAVAGTKSRGETIFHYTVGTCVQSPDEDTSPPGLPRLHQLQALQASAAELLAAGKRMLQKLPL